MNAAQLFIQCLENEGVEYIFGVPGEENLEVMDALLDSSIRFITTRDRSIIHIDRAQAEVDEHYNVTAGYRVTGPGQLQGILKKALAQPTVSIVDCPVDYSENLKLTEQLGNLVCPI